MEQGRDVRERVLKLGTQLGNILLGRSSVHAFNYTPRSSATGYKADPHSLPQTVKEQHQR